MSEEQVGEPGRMGSRTSDDAPSARTFLHDLMFEFDASVEGASGSLTITAPMMAPEADRPLLSVLATVADVFTGIPITHRHPNAVALTVDLSLRLLRPIPVGTYEIESNVVKYGRTVVVTEAVVRAHDESVAHCWATFVPFAVADRVRFSAAAPRIGTGGLTEPFLDAVGIRVVGPGVAMVDKTAYTLQPAGTIQGGTIAAVVEAAAASILGQSLSDIDVRYLATVKNGPARATAVALDDRTARVTVVDAGADHQRTTAVALVRS